MVQEFTERRTIRWLKRLPIAGFTLLLICCSVFFLWVLLLALTSRRGHSEQVFEAHMLASDVGFALRCYYDEHGQNPPDSLREALVTVKETKVFKEMYEERDLFRRYWRGDHFVDPWGNELRWDGKAQRVYSVGPNGIDEYGKGDDLPKITDTSPSD